MRNEEWPSVMSDNTLGHSSSLIPHPSLNRLSQHHLALQGDITLFNKSDRHKFIGWRADIIKRPVLIVSGKHLADAFGAIDQRKGAIFPVEQFYAVVQLLFQAVDSNLYFNLLFAWQGRDRNCDVCHMKILNLLEYSSEKRLPYRSKKHSAIFVPYFYCIGLGRVDDKG